MSYGVVTLLSICLILCINGSKSAIKCTPPKPPPDPPAVLSSYFVSSPIRAKHELFLKDVIRVLLDQGVFFNEHSERFRGPFLWRSPGKLGQLLNMTLGEDGCTQSELLHWIKQAIKYSPHPSQPYMLDKHVAGLDPYALAGDWLVSTINGNGGVYFDAPAFTLFEMEIFRRLAKLFGWTGDSDGMTTTGAGVANNMAVSLALQQKYPNLKVQGLTGVGNPKVVMFVSEHASPAFEKGSLYQNLASNGVVKVKCDHKTGRMDVQHLRKRIVKARRDKFVPFMVVATAGTHDLGAIDDLASIAKVCKEFGLWFHVDAEKGGALLFNPRLRDRLNGIEHANSVTFGTWMLATPYATSVLMVQGEGKLTKTFGTDAHYLFDRGSTLYNTTYDSGDGTVQSSRRLEIAKLWYAWQARGSNGMAALVDQISTNSVHLVRHLQFRNGFELIVANPDLPQVAFYYVPTTLRTLNRTSVEFVDKVSAITALVKAELLERNLVQISTSRLRQGYWALLPEFFIASLTNLVLRPANFEYILDLIQTMAETKALNKRAEFTAGGISLPELTSVWPIGNSINAPIQLLHGKFLSDTFRLLIDRGIFFSRGESPFNFLQPEDLKLKLNLNLTRDGASHTALLQEFETVIKYSPHRSHPYSLYQLQGGLQPYTIAADWVASVLNTPMLTYEDSPVFTLMELSVLSALRKRIFGTSEGDGAITDGGSMANQMAIAMALYVKDPRVHVMGLGIAGGKKFVGYMSQDAHYSTQKGFIIQNLGFENVIIVDSDDNGRMKPKRLEAAIKDTLAQGNIPFFVCTTTGTTVYGAIDPVSDIVKLCRKYGLWCHVDGMVGGLLAMSDHYSGRLTSSLQQVDSFGTDFHKLLGATMTIAVLITRRPNILRETFGIGPPKVERNNALYNRTKWDIGANHFQLDKRNNVFKLWFLWKAIGRKGFEGHLNLVMDNAAYLVQQLHQRRHEGFRPILMEFDITNVCFYYVPTTLRGANRPSNITEYNERLSKVSFDLEVTLARHGVMDFVAQYRLNNTQPALIKFPMMNSALSKVDVDYLLDAVAYYGERLD